MSSKRVIATLLIGTVFSSVGMTTQVSASHCWASKLKSIHRTTKSKTDNGQTLKQNADEAVSPIIGQYGKNVTYTNGSYTINTDNQLNAKVSSAPYVNLSSIDTLGRAGVANAFLSKSSRQRVSRDKTGNDTKIEPVGFKQTKIGNKYVYNRGHLIGYALAGKVKAFDASESNRKNIVTETAWANQSKSNSSRGQLYYENLVRMTLDGKGNPQVRYRVTPVYYKNEVVPRAIHMEAKSRDGKLNFNVLVPNAMKGANIDYATGNVR